MWHQRGWCCSRGGDAAGKVIEAFGSVVIGGNYYVVGLVVF